MSESWILLAVEDALSEATARQLILQSGKAIRVAQCLGHRGVDFLRLNIRKYNEAARRYPVFVLADLDTPDPCPPTKIKAWLGAHRQSQNLLLRFAVMEVEAWLLAHSEAIADFLKVSQRLVPQSPDDVPDPKEQLVRLARRSRSRRIREDIVPRAGSQRMVGPDYNRRLTELVNQHWKAEAASQRSPSLRKTIDRLHQLAPRI